MSLQRRQFKRVRSKQRRFMVRGVRRDQVDLHKFTRALIGLAAAEAERQAQAEYNADPHRSQQSGSAAASGAPARLTGGTDD